MQSKIVWLSFSITMVYWLGGVLGCATSSHDTQNYRMLEEEKDIFNPSPPGDGVNEVSEAMPRIQVQLASLDMPQKITESARASEPAVVEATGRDWGRMVLGPDQGITEHWPHHFKDWSALMSKRERIDFEQPLEDQMNAALADATCSRFRPLDIVATVGQPLKFAVDMATWPLFAVAVEPAWISVSTPRPRK